MSDDLDFLNPKSEDTLTEDEREQVLALAPKPEERINTMLFQVKEKKMSSIERVTAAFEAHKLSPLDELLYEVKAERAKLDVYNMAESKGYSKKFLEALPKPDKKRYTELLLKLVDYQVPALRSIEIKGEIALGMQVHIIQRTKEAKVIELDEKSPAKLLLGNKKEAPVIEVTSKEIEEDDI